MFCPAGPSDWDHLYLDTDSDSVRKHETGWTKWDAAGIR